MRLAGKVMLFSKDTDIDPAMKAAQINGFEAILPTFREDELVPEVLLKYADLNQECLLVAIVTALCNR